MKKILTKIRRKKANESQQPSLRITNDTVAEHREQVLAGGRKFKYPIQYARHKLVINTIVISVVAVIILMIIGWFQLYRAQNTSDFMYRVTRIIPVPVAYIDNEPVKYSDYLMKYRSAVHYLRQKEQVSLNSEDGERQIAYIKDQSMQDALADAYAARLAREENVSVSNKEVEEFIAEQRLSADNASPQTYDAVILDYYNWTPDEYRHTIRAKLLRQKVAYAIDETAQKQSEEFATKVRARNVDLRKLVDAYNAKSDNKVTYGASGWVPRTNQDGGLAAHALKLPKGQISTALRSTVGDGYYFVRQISSDEDRVNYEYIKIPLREFDRRIVNLSETDTNILIDIPEPETLQQQ